MSGASDNPTASLLVSLEESLRLHDIGAEVFAPFVIERFRAGDGATFVELSVTLTDEQGLERDQLVRLTWQAQSVASKPFAVQERVMTEWGALGVACALSPSLLGKRILSVAVEGERFDYRIGNEAGEWGLEVSGALSESREDLRERHRLKVRQLRENPARLSGHVIVVGFTLREVLISFHFPYPEEIL